MRQQVRPRGFVVGKRDRSLHDVAAIRHHLHGFVAQAPESLGKLEQTTPAGVSSTDFAERSSLGVIGLLQLANLRAHRGLRAKHLLPRLGKALELGYLNERSELVEVHS